MVLVLLVLFESGDFDLSASRNTDSGIFANTDSGSSTDSGLFDSGNNIE